MKETGQIAISSSGDHSGRFRAQAHRNVQFLGQLIPKSEKVYAACWTPEEGLISSTLPEELASLLEQSFSILGCAERLRSLTDEEDLSRPHVLGSPLGLYWAAFSVPDAFGPLCFLLGPVFYSLPGEAELKAGLRPFVHSVESAAWARGMQESRLLLPVVPYGIFLRYAAMACNALTGAQLGTEDIVLSPGTGSGTVNPVPAVPETARSREKIYQAEKAMLQMVREGDINYQNVLGRSSLLSSGAGLQSKDPLRRAKDSIIIFVTLVSRAAMEGGLSPETAYALGDSYMQAVEDSNDSGELSALAVAMYHDFIYRVHHLRANPGLSTAVQKCCDYIDLSLDRKIRTEDLAELLGYTPYYLTEKFRNETGRSLSSYIREKKIERAKVLLSSTDLSIGEIAEKLAFSTVNYFIMSFRKQTGTSPAQYRKAQKS